MTDWSAVLVGMLIASGFWVTVGFWAYWKAFKLLSTQHASDAIAEFSRNTLVYLDADRPDRARTLLETAAAMD